MRRNPRILVYSAGDRDVNTVDAAARGGALGVLDLCWLDPNESAAMMASPRRVARRSGRPFAVRVAAATATTNWLADLPATRRDGDPPPA